MNITEAKEALKYCDEIGKVPLLEGVHGIGKSQIVKEYAKENGYSCEILILSLMDTGDLLGIPKIVNDGNDMFTNWAAPVWFKRILDNEWTPNMIDPLNDLEFTDKDFEKFIMDNISLNGTDRQELNKLYLEYIGETNTDKLLIHTQNLVKYKKSKKTVLFLDEFNRSTPDILNASLELILNKRLNEHILPIDTFVVAAINPDDSDYTTTSMDPALLDRFVHFKIEPDGDQWIEWAKDNNINNAIIEFISTNNDKLYIKSENELISATPRSWEALSKFVDRFNEIPKELHYNIIKGCVGPSVGSQFFVFYNERKVIKKEDIIKLVNKEYNKTNNIEEVGNKVKEYIKELEVIQKQEMANQLYKMFIKDNTNEKIGIALLGYLYSLEVEILTTFLKSKKKDDAKFYKKLTELDNNINKKALFMRIARKIRMK